jgi:hypothetical protein
MSVPTFRPRVMTEKEEALRAEVREFLAERLPRGTYRPGLGMSAGADPEFSRELGRRGYLCVTIPEEYGGQGGSAVERFVIVEELLSAGAPVAAHWAADRQTAATLMLYGTEEQRRRFIPAIARGECSFSLGMSEPDSGSDLAAVRTRGRKVEGGWLVNGRKTWTSGAHRNDYFAVLCRTSEATEDRHQGLSQLIVDLRSEGVTVLPIEFLNGEHHFNDVVLEDVFVPDDMVLGEVGDGWRQVTGELAFERSGPDRFLSPFPVLESYVREHGDPDDERQAEVVGRLVSRFWALRQISLSVAESLDSGEAPKLEASLVKDIGTTFEQRVSTDLQGLADAEPLGDGDSLFEQLLSELVLTNPSFTIRGGTTEILRTVIAKGLRS